MKTNLSFCMLPLCSVLLLCTAAAPPTLRAVAAREITVGTRWPQLIAKSGKVFRNVKFTYVSPREVRFMHTDGIGSLPVGDLVMPDDVNMPVLAAAADAAMPPELTMGPLGSMMTPQERKVSGIDKLSNDEQATLAKWVLGTVEDRLKVELERRGLPPTFAPLETVPVAGLGAAPGAGVAAGAAMAVGTVPAASVAGLAPAPAAAAAPAPAVTARANGALGAAGLAPKQPQLMAAAPGRTYVPPSKPGAAAPSPLLPPPAPAEAPTAAAEPRPVSSSTALPTASPTQIARTIDPVAVSAVMAASKAAAAAPSSSPMRQPAAAGARTGGRQVKGGIGLVESSIAGEFRGLEAGRQFRLINGQTWLQEEAFAQDHLAFKPRVTIYPADDGWMMAVDGVNKAVRVLPVN